MKRVKDIPLSSSLLPLAPVPATQIGKAQGLINNGLLMYAQHATVMRVQNVPLSGLQ